MKIAFTRSSYPLSILIRWGLKEPVSHTIIIFDEKVAVHSNLLGVHLSWLKTFTKTTEIVFEKNYPMSLIEEETIYQAILDEADELPYDFGAFFYMIYRAIALRLFNIPFPNTNAWQKNNTVLCTEILKYLPEKYIVKTKSDLAMTSPYQLWLQIKD